MVNALRLRVAPEGARRCSHDPPLPTCSGEGARLGELLASVIRARRHPLALTVALPGLVPPPPRAAPAARLAAARSSGSPASSRRARGAGSLLRLGRDLQRHPAGRRAGPRRPQGGQRPRDRRAGAYASANPAASSRSRRRSGRAGTRPLPALHPSSSLDASIRGVGAAEPARAGPPLTDRRQRLPRCRPSACDPVQMAAQDTTASTGRSSSRRSTCASAGKSLLQVTATRSSRRRRRRRRARRRSARPPPRTRTHRARSTR